MIGKSRYTIVCIAFLVAVANVACLCMYWPSPTDSTISSTDLAGTYTYQFEGGTITVYLNADSTFEIVDSPSLSGEGTWDVNEEAEIVLYYQEPTSYTAIPGWYVIGGMLGRSFSIIGGEGDPDLWNGLTRVR